MLRQTWKFFTLTFAISWLLWLPTLLRSTVMPDLPEIVGLFGLFAPFGPGIAAFILVYQESSWDGVKKFAGRAISLDFNKWWLVPMIFLFPLMGLLMMIIMPALGESLEWTVPSIIAFVGTFFIILLVGGGLEEFGWRGYALDPLQKNSNALTASLVLGFMWGLWHLPLHFIAGTVQENIPVWQFILQTMVIAVLYTWLYNNTNGSLLVAILFHTIGNTTSAMLPPYFATNLGRWVNFSILLAMVVIVLAIWGWREMTNTSKTEAKI